MVAGKADKGVSFAVQTIVCRECKELLDAVTRLRTEAPPLAAWPNVATPQRAKSLGHRWAPESAPSFQAALNRLPLQGAKRVRWVDFKLRCPVSSLHRIQVWNEPGKCPKCGTYLEKSVLPFRIWD